MIRRGDALRRAAERFLLTSRSIRRRMCPKDESFQRPHLRPASSAVESSARGKVRQLAPRVFRTQSCEVLAMYDHIVGGPFEQSDNDDVTVC
jgi:hypothetical protein